MAGGVIFTVTSSRGNASFRVLQRGSIAVRVTVGKIMKASVIMFAMICVEVVGQDLTHIPGRPPLPSVTLGRIEMGPPGRLTKKASRQTILILRSSGIC